MLLSISAVLASILVGISCATLIPSSFILEVSLAVGMCLISAVLMYSATRGNRRVAEEDVMNSINQEIPSMIFDSMCTESGGVEDKPGTPSSFDVVDDAELDDSSSLDSSGRTNGTGFSDQDEYSNASPSDAAEELRQEAYRDHAPPSLSDGQDESKENYPPEVDERIIDHRRRLLVSSERARVKSAAHYLRFQDSTGEVIRYAVRNSRKRPTAVLELLVSGQKPKKIKQLVCDNDSHIINDGKNEFSIPPEDFANVMKSLNLLCKVASVRFEYKVAE